MQTHKHNGIHIVEHENNGPPLIFIHAFPLCHRMWDSQVEYFKDKYRVILYDARGLGYSTVPDEQYMMENLADDLIDVMDFLSIDKAHACGLSMGGYTLLRALTKNPDRFNSVILADTRAERDDDNGLKARYAMFNSVKTTGTETLIRDFTKKLLNEANYGNDTLRSFVEEMTSWQTVEGVCGALICLATRTNTLDELRNLDVPALILVGEDDVLTPIPFSERMRDALVNSELKIIPNSGHLANMENPQEFNKSIETFLAKIS
ncbi:MAG: alpha/beta fold hydrolase [Ignavibacteriae bacterium]|nr:alpha/beta fold hydrolase [Ignavibacteriota bacterium]MCB9243361.1 alpha/beta fold hydrolase [Ignavibacteriales bacterium]